MKGHTNEPARLARVWMAARARVKLQMFYKYSIGKGAMDQDVSGGKSESASVPMVL